ncbi:MAG: hypothetical protein GKR96_04790 [Gammaproteobacteria bacterium]|nr:hypothetical protein [Gammaproteobacteria bacterium]
MFVITSQLAHSGSTDSTNTRFNVGFARSTIADPMGGTMKYSVWYPTHTPNSVVELGPFEFEGTRKAPMAPGKFGLVLISHGTEGSDLGHRSIAVELAKAGIITAAPLHPRNNFRNNSGVGQRIVWDGRPRQISSIIDSLLQSTQFGPSINTDQIGIFGFSAGGYTAISLLGAPADFQRLVEHCKNRHHMDPVCHHIDGKADEFEKMIDTQYPDAPLNFKDSRICSAVLADPLAVMFSESALRKIIDLPILLYLPEIQNELAAKFHGQHVFNTLISSGREKIRIEQIPGAHHFSFITPFPEKIARSIPKIANDFGDFDREVFHQTLKVAISQFFLNAFIDCE